MMKLDMPKFKFDKKSMPVVVAVLAIAITGVLLISNSSYGNYLPFLKFNLMSPDQVAKKSVDYLNSSVLQQGTQAKLLSVSKESGLIKIKVEVGGTTYDSYATKDGKLFFPTAFAIDTKSGQTSSNTQANQPEKQTPANLTKVDNSVVEAYIVSRCPYGLQMQRAMADAIKSLPSLADHIKIKYMGSISNGVITSMHGDQEAQENLRQICIRDEQNSKYWDYVSCQMKNGDTAGCQASVDIDASKLNACVADSKRGLAYAAEDFALNTKYNIQGSPTLILNGKQISEFDFGGRSSDAVKTIICDSSSQQPEFCSTKLNTNQAATSFSATYSSSSSSSGGSATTANAASCAPAAPS